MSDRLPHYFKATVAIFVAAILSSCDRRESTTASRSATQPSTQPLSQVIAAQHSSASVPSITGSFPEDADARLPIELTVAEHQKLVSDLDYLEASWSALKERAGHFSDDYAAISSDAVEQSLWDRLRGQGFKDKQLPLDWTRLIKGQGTPSSLAALSAMLKAQFYETGLLYDDISGRIRPIRTDLLGGTVIKYDDRFVHEFQRRVDFVDQNLDATESALTDVFSRYNAEFPDRQLSFERIHKRDVHSAGLSAESSAKLVTEIDSLTDDLGKLPGAERAFRMRMRAFSRTFKEIAREAADRQLIHDVDQKETELVGWGLSVEEPQPLTQVMAAMLTRAIKSKALIEKTQAAIAFNLIDYSQFPADHRSIPLIADAVDELTEGLTAVRAALNERPRTVTVDGVQQVAEVRNWYLQQVANSDTGHALLDQIRDLAKEEGLPLAWDAAPHVFSAGSSILDRGVENPIGPFSNESDFQWNKELDKRADEIAKFLQECDAARTKPSFKDFYSDRGFLSKQLPLAWRRELRRRVFAKQVIVIVPIDEYDVTAPKKYAPIVFHHIQADEDFNVTWK